MCLLCCILIIILFTPSTEVHSKQCDTGNSSHTSCSLCLPNASFSFMLDLIAAILWPKCSSWTLYTHRPTRVQWATSCRREGWFLKMCFLLQRCPTDPTSRPPSSVFGCSPHARPTQVWRRTSPRRLSAASLVVMRVTSVTTLEQTSTYRDSWMQRLAGFECEYTEPYSGLHGELKTQNEAYVTS